MLRKLTTFKSKVALTLGLAAFMAFSLVGSAFAAEGEPTVDYSKVTSGASSQISAAVPIALGVVGLFVGIMIAYKLLRRIVRA
jgi:hypothetical protein